MGDIMGVVGHVLQSGKKSFRGLYWLNAILGVLLLIRMLGLPLAWCSDAFLPGGLFGEVTPYIAFLNDCAGKLLILSGVVIGALGLVFGLLYAVLLWRNIDFVEKLEDRLLALWLGYKSFGEFLILLSSFAIMLNEFVSPGSISGYSLFGFDFEACLLQIILLAVSIYCVRVVAWEFPYYSYMELKRKAGLMRERRDME